MGQFNMVLTDAGAALLEYIHGNPSTPLNFVRMASGSGTLVGDPADRTALVTEEQTADIAACSVAEDGTAVIRADFPNTEVETGYTFKELGLFAEDPETPAQEILYAYGNAGANGDYMPPFGETLVVRIQEIVVTIGETATVTAVIDEETVYATQADLADHVGHGGTDQHPAATAAEAGFMSAADKAKMDLLSAGGWEVQIKDNVNVTTLTGWYEATELARTVANLFSLRGEVLFNGAITEDRNASHLFTMRIETDGAKTLTLRTLRNHDLVHYYFHKHFGDLAMIDGGGYAGGASGERTLTVELPAAGEYAVFILLNNDAAGRSQLMLAEWFDLPGMTWVGWGSGEAGM